MFENDAVSIARTPQRQNKQGKARQPVSYSEVDPKRAHKPKHWRRQTVRAPNSKALTVPPRQFTHQPLMSINMSTSKMRNKSNGSDAIATGTPMGDGPTAPRGKGNAATITPSEKSGESDKDTSTEATGVKQDCDDKVVDAANAAATKAAVAAGEAAKAKATTGAVMEDAAAATAVEVEAVEAAKLVSAATNVWQAEATGDDPIAEAAARKAATLSKIKEKKKEVKQQQML